jgi:hypothetical protein
MERQAREEAERALAGRSSRRGPRTIPTTAPGALFSAAFHFESRRNRDPRRSRARGREAFVARPRARPTPPSSRSSLQELALRRGRRLPRSRPSSHFRFRVRTEPTRVRAHSPRRLFVPSVPEKPELPTPSGFASGYERRESPDPTRRAVTRRSAIRRSRSRSPAGRSDRQRRRPRVDRGNESPLQHVPAHLSTENLCPAAGTRHDAVEPGLRCSPRRRGV